MMSEGPAAIPTRPIHEGSSAPTHAGLLAMLRRPRVGVALLVLFTFVVGVVSQGLFFSIDETYQWNAAQHSLPYIITHNPQDHPFYGVLVYLSVHHLPELPISPLRLPAFLAGMLVPLVFYLTNRRYAGHEAALLVAMVLVMMDPLRYYMSVGRGYSLMLLSVLLLNHWVLTILRRGRWGLALVYVPVGVLAGFTHLWAYPVVGAHGFFLALEVVRRRGRGVLVRRALGMMGVVALTLVLGVLAYLPMAEILRAVAGRRGHGLLLFPLITALLQLPRFASWTVAVHLLLVPIILEGFARRPLRIGRDRTARMYLWTIVVLLAWASLTHSVYFGSRYLLGLVPGAAGLIARGLSGYWVRTPVRRRLPVLPRPATWAIGLALGILSTNAPIAHEIPCGASTGRDGKDSGYYYRTLSKAIGDPVAVGLLVAGVAGLAWARRSRRDGATPGRERPDSVVSAYVWTAVLLASLVPVFLGPSFSPQLFEVHMLTVAAVLLDAWEHRFSNRHLYALRYAFLVIAGLAVAWQATIALPHYSPEFLLGLLMYVPPVLIVLPLARTTGPAFSDGR